MTHVLKSLQIFSSKKLFVHTLCKSHSILSYSSVNNEFYATIPSEQNQAFNKRLYCTDKQNEAFTPHISKEKFEAMEGAKEVQSFIQNLQRPAFLPTFTESKNNNPNNNNDDIFASKFGGIPYLKDEEWPSCGSCNEDMKLHLQISMKHAPTQFKEKIGKKEGLLQLFVCKDLCDFDPNNNYYLIRHIKAKEIDKTITIKDIPSPQTEKAIEPVKKVDSWKEIKDVPTIDEMETMDYRIYELLKVHGIGDAVSAHYHPHTGDKLLGYANWCKYVEYCICPECCQPMKDILIQIEGASTNTSIGNQGSLFIQQCPDHKHHKRLVWSDV